MCGRTAIVAQHDSIGVRAYEGYGLACREGQQRLLPLGGGWEGAILQQHDTLLRSLQRQLLVLLTLQLRCRNIAPRAAVVELAQGKTCLQHPYEGPVKLLHGQQAILHGLLHSSLEYGSAVHKLTVDVVAGLDGCRRRDGHIHVVDISGIVGIRAVVIAKVEVLHITVDAAHSGTVARHVALEAPLIAQDAGEQPVVHGIGLTAIDLAACTRVAKAYAGGVLLIGISAEGVVRRHDAPHVTFLHTHLKGREIVFAQHALRDERSRALTTLLIVVRGEMLRAGYGLKIRVLRSLFTLHALDELHGQLSGQERVLAIILLVASPTRVAAHVDGGTPVVQSLLIYIIIYTRLIADGRGAVVYELSVPCGRHGLRLREAGSGS